MSEETFEFEYKTIPTIQTALVLLSGGMDSAVALAIAKRECSDVEAITFHYGQKHAKEMYAAKAIAKHFNVPIMKIEVPIMSRGSVLTDPKSTIPPFEQDVWKKVAQTYVPARNLIFISLAASIAEILGHTYIYTGYNWIDSGGYPDTTQPFVDAINHVLFIGTRDKPQVRAPLVNMTKAEIVNTGLEFKVPFELTWSCYEGKDKPCGRCNACIQRKKGFDEAQQKDPLVA